MHEGQPLQIHIGGAKRSGKSTLADNIKLALERLEELGLDPQVLDVDRVRMGIFGAMRGTPDSEQSRADHNFTMETIFQFLIGSALTSKYTPITVAGHSSIVFFNRSKEIATKHQARLKFLVLRPPTLEEAERRAAESGDEDSSDMKDFSDPKVRESFIQAAKRINDTYANVTDPSFHWIEQGTEGEMALQALKFILDKPDLSLEQVMKLIEKK